MSKFTICKQQLANFSWVTNCVDVMLPPQIYIYILGLTRSEIVFSLICNWVWQTPSRRVPALVLVLRCLTKAETLPDWVEFLRSFGDQTIVALTFLLQSVLSVICCICWVIHQNAVSGVSPFWGFTERRFIRFPVIGPRHCPPLPRKMPLLVFQTLYKTQPSPVLRAEPVWHVECSDICCK